MTTNPSIIAKERRDFYAIIRDIRALIGNERMLHVQVLGTTYEDIIRDAETLRSRISGNLYVKVPVSVEGFKAFPELKRRGFQVTATAIYSPGQALLAASWGVDFTAPYLNRIDNISGMGVTVVRMILDQFRVHGLKTRVLAASFKDIHQVNEVSLCGCQAITVSPDVLWKVAEHSLTDLSVQKFTQDWEGVYGAGVCVHNLPETQAAH